MLRFVILWKILSALFSFMFNNKGGCISLHLRMPTSDLVVSMHATFPSQEAAKDKESLKSHGITHILTVNGKEPAFKDDFAYR